MAKKKTGDQESAKVENQNTFMRILLSTSLDANTHLKEYEFEIFDNGDDQYHVVGKSEKLETLDFLHTWKQD